MDPLSYDPLAGALGAQTALDPTAIDTGTTLDMGSNSSLGSILDGSQTASAADYNPNAALQSSPAFSNYWGNSPSGSSPSLLGGLFQGLGAALGIGGGLYAANAAYGQAQMPFLSQFGLTNPVTGQMTSTGMLVIAGGGLLVLFAVMGK